MLKFAILVVLACVAVSVSAQSAQYCPSTDTILQGKAQYCINPGQTKCQVCTAPGQVTKLITQCLNASHAAITFDGGISSATTDALVTLLDQRGVKATFFVNGNSLKNPQNAALLQKMDTQYGHLIGNGGMTGQAFGTSIPSNIAEAIQCSDQIQSVIGKRPRYIRFPQFDPLVVAGRDEAWINSLRLTPVCTDRISGYNVDTRDFAVQNTPGAIVVPVINATDKVSGGLDGGNGLPTITTGPIPPPTYFLNTSCADCSGYNGGTGTNVTVNGYPCTSPTTCNQTVTYEAPIYTTFPSPKISVITRQSDLNGPTNQQVGQIINALRLRGYKLVTLDECYGDTYRYVTDAAAANVCSFTYSPPKPSAAAGLGVSVLVVALGAVAALFL